MNNGRLANILRIPSPILFKCILVKSKFYLKNCLFTQVIKENIKEILKIKKAFLKLLPGKIIEI